VTRIPFADRDELSPRGRELLDRTPAPEAMSVLANAKDSFVPWTDVVRGLRESPDLDLRLRELIILRTASRVGCEYELGHHRPIAADAGLTPEQIEAACSGAALEGNDGVIVSLVDDLFQGRGVSDERVEEALGLASTRTLVEAIVIAGVYVTIGRMIEAAGLS
jgi:AhpD family alkylhydroperoxidase